MLISPYVVLHRDGQIGGVDDSRFRRWKLGDTGVVLVDEAGASAMTLLMGEAGPDAQTVLIERTDKADAIHCLIETKSLLVEPKQAESCVLAPLPRRRPNLVVLRAGTNSVHPSWLKDIDDGDRNWDLCVSWYDSAESFSRCPTTEYSILQNTDRKFQSLHKLLYPGSPVLDYDYVAFPDDDVEMSWRDLNRTFEIAKCHNLTLCQPALHPSSFYSHQITVQQADKRLRFTNFVEVMFPVFSRDALGRCAGSFLLSDSSWGLDQLWPKLLGGHQYRIGIIDAVAVRHTRPVGGSYDMASAFADKHRLIQTFAAPEDYREFGFIV
ncbi:MAG: DUF707 domain-containing protein [Parafilimonas terrae]|nr:DUF707 domain-containing protein [Parafilimonas terrae]